MIFEKPSFDAVRHTDNGLVFSKHRLLLIFEKNGQGCPAEGKEVPELKGQYGLVPDFVFGIKTITLRDSGQG